MKKAETERTNPIVKSVISMNPGRGMFLSPIKRKRTSGSITTPKKWKII